VIGDEWAVMRSGRATVGDYLDLVSAVHGDPNSIVLGDAVGKIQTIEARIAGDKNERTALQAWVRKEFSPVYQALGPMPQGSAAEPQDKKQLRALLFGLLGAAKDPAVVAEAKQLTDKWIADQTSVDPSLAKTAASVAAENGDAALYDRLLAMSAAAKDPSITTGALFLTASSTTRRL